MLRGLHRHLPALTAILLGCFSLQIFAQQTFTSYTSLGPKDCNVQPVPTDTFNEEYIKAFAEILHIQINPEAIRWEKLHIDRKKSIITFTRPYYVMNDGTKFKYYFGGNRKVSALAIANYLGFHNCYELSIKKDISEEIRAYVNDTRDDFNIGQGRKYVYQISCVIPTATGLKSYFAANASSITNKKIVTGLHLFVKADLEKERRVQELKKEIELKVEKERKEDEQKLKEEKEAAELKVKKEKEEAQNQLKEAFHKSIAEALASDDDSYVLDTQENKVYSFLGNVEDEKDKLLLHADDADKVLRNDGRFRFLEKCEGRDCRLVHFNKTFHMGTIVTLDNNENPFVVAGLFQDLVYIQPGFNIETKKYYEGGGGKIVSALSLKPLKVKKIIAKANAIDNTSSHGKGEELTRESEGKRKGASEKVDWQRVKFSSFIPEVVLIKLLSEIANWPKDGQDVFNKAKDNVHNISSIKNQANNWNVLHYAVAYNSINVVKWYLDNKGDPNIKANLSQLSAKPSYGYLSSRYTLASFFANIDTTPLLSALFLDSIEIARLLLKSPLNNTKSQIEFNFSSESLIRGGSNFQSMFPRWIELRGDL